MDALSTLVFLSLDPSSVTSIYLDVVIRGSNNKAGDEPLVAERKDRSLWALDLRSSSSR